MSKAHELFTLERRIPWGDTDAAGTIYVAHVARYCLEAMEAWFVARLGIDWFALNADRRLAAPCVRVELDFKRGATPRDRLALAVTIAEVGRSSVLFRVVGSIGDPAATCWEGRFKSVFTDANTGRSTPIPLEYREAFEHELVLVTAMAR
ncbi:MAG: thioesterase family protein [Pseudomonadota bacterium]